MATLVALVGRDKSGAPSSQSLSASQWIAPTTLKVSRGIANNALNKERDASASRRPEETTASPGPRSSDFSNTAIFYSSI